MSGRCITSHLVEYREAPTARNGQQNYWKYIDVFPHTVEFERLCGAAGMVAHERQVDTSLIKGNALRFATRSGKSPPKPIVSQAGASSPYKSAAAASGNASRLGKGILWNIGPFDIGSFYYRY
ncbi:hypothetical protein PILCRDRAFT_16926 [Piloderma croceum F 1598]|uniref:Uncharacterized protein n=1 Tax=Piloderma croceum (strain F 1598) TaxID=765440 RepID=A0A0C3EUX0_PILCF|nr:hypothetical protein PILCRDRAFT_16926 [Piloderma croceum F 1598]